MPQGKRKVPFSGKAKKEQLKNKHKLKQQQGRKVVINQNSDEETDRSEIKKINQQPHKSGRNSNRYALQFYCDSPEELKQNKLASRQEIVPVEEKNLEINIDDYFPEEIDFPKRPSWSYEMDKNELEIKEQRYLTNYLKELENKDWKKMSYFELNLETWRQFWRVLEMSDIILFIIDIRYSAAMFPPSLYYYITDSLQKDIILVLNKVDLAPASLVVAWKQYFQTKFPKIHVILFTTLPGYNLRGNQTEKSGLKIRRRKGRIRMAAEGAQLLYETCQSIVGNDVDLASWRKKIQEEMSAEYEDEDLDIGEVFVEKLDTGFFQHEKFKNNILTIGCIGQPNVGKSSLMNAVMGKKVVSVSKTPGHTKHFQTIYLTENVRLCDCPGLVFPSQVPKPLQVLMGSYPIAQLRDPYMSIKFLAERLDLVRLLRLEHPTGDDSWSAVDICDGWAKKRGFLTAKTARFDTYRAANNLLRMALDGKICLCLYPPNYSNIKDVFESHPEIKQVLWIQALTDQENEAGSIIISDDSDSNDEENKQNKKPQSEQEDSDETTESESENNPVQINKFSLLEVE